MRKLDSLCLFCGSSSGANPVYKSAAHHFGKTLAERDIRLVYGGGSVGLMGIAADACMAAGGKVIGVIPKLLMEKEVGHKGITEMHLVANMHERKALMTELSDGFIALPGGYGTLDELFEALTWLQLGYHRKPVGLLNVDGFFNHLVSFIDHSRDERFLRDVHRDSLCEDADLGQLINKLRASEVPDAGKWLDQAKFNLSAT
ncbi:MAG: TIGR00730 family Rossman fold protein [Betaproteobacteria bacterium]|nr:TIGR00730 family Rossman fold protein [Betaproteobacteria bacterium]